MEKLSNCRSSQGSLRNNSFFHSKKSKKGFVTNFTSNNIGRKLNTDEKKQNKSLIKKFREFFAHRQAYSLFIWNPNSG